MTSPRRLASFVYFALVLTACAGKMPETRYYQLATPTATSAASTASARGTHVLVLEPLTSESAYDDERIVYRTNAYRLDYYQYHRWSASPGIVVGNYLEQALERSGQFRSVVRELHDTAPVVLGGRVIAIEEVDDSRAAWKGRIVLELSLTDTKSGAIVWSEQYEEHEPLPVQTPEGLARALSAALQRIATKAVPAIVAVADRQAQLQATTTTPTVTRR